MKNMDFLIPFKRVSQLTLRWVGFNSLNSDMPESQTRVGSWKAIPWPWSCSRGCSQGDGVWAA